MERKRKGRTNIGFSIISPRTTDRRFTLTILFALVLNLVLATVLALQSPGLQYDEALMAHGAVHMLKGVGEPTFAHDRGSWVKFDNRWFPLMVIPYVGAAKHYLLLGPFALFGPRVLIVRLVSAVLAAFGIWGLAQLVRQEIGPFPAALIAFVLAIHPAYLQQTVFDSTGVSMWMGCLGLVCLSLARYIRRPTSGASLLLGLACGFAIWARLNFIWLLGSAAAAALLIWRKEAFPPLHHIPLILVGGIVGSAPVIAYEVLSRFATIRFMNTHALNDSFVTLLPVRLFHFSELLVSDSEVRRMWAGPPIPSWQHLTFSLVLLGGIVATFLIKQDNADRTTRWRRGFAINLVIFIGLMLTSRMNVLPHHMITALPLAIAVVVLACHALIKRLSQVVYTTMVIVTFCVSIMLYWTVASVAGLHRTGGVNHWSDAIFTVADTIARNYPDQPVKVLDWGFGNNLYVLSNGRIHVQELFWGATEKAIESGERWSDLVAQGGVFLTGGDRSLYGAFAPATKGFRDALVAANVNFFIIPFRERGGTIFAELVEVVGAATSDRQMIRSKEGIWQ